MSSGTKGLEAAREKLRVLKASGQYQAPERTDPLGRARANPQSRALAMDAKCWDCCGAGADGEAFTRETIRECPCTDCPLHAFRPYQRVGTELALRAPASDVPEPAVSAQSSVQGLPK